MIHNGNFIRKWESIVEASRILNIPSPNIINCCQHKCKIIGGFKWEYAPEDFDTIKKEIEDMGVRLK